MSRRTTPTLPPPEPGPLGLFGVHPDGQADAARLILAVWLLRDALVPIIEGEHYCVYQPEWMPKKVCIRCRLQAHGTFIQTLMEQVPAFAVERGLCHNGIIDRVRETYGRLQGALEELLQKASADQPLTVAR